MITYFLFVSPFLQDVQGWTALAAALAFLPMTLISFVVAAAVPRLTRSFGPTRMMLTGLVLALAGMVWLTMLTPTSAFLIGIAVPGPLIGAGQDLLFTHLTTAGRHDVPATPSGAAVAGTKDPLTVFGDDWPTPDGTPIRDDVHVLDLARAHVQALTAAASGEHLICNLGSGDGYSVREVLTTIEQVTGTPVPHSVGPRRAGDPTRLVASNDRARQRLGWTPQLTLADMVTDAWQFASDGTTTR